MARILPDDIVTGITGDLIELAIVSDNPKKAKKILDEF